MDEQRRILTGWLRSLAPNCLRSPSFKWAKQPGRKYVSVNPLADMARRGGKEKRRDRVLTDAEIRTLWHGLDVKFYQIVLTVIGRTARLRSCPRFVGVG
jgi:hypothetical protein